MKFRCLAAITKTALGSTDGREGKVLLTRGPDPVTGSGAGKFGREPWSTILGNVTFDSGQGCGWGFTAQYFR